MSPGGRQPFEIEWTAPARRALSRIPEKAATACIEFIYSALVDNPKRAGRSLRFELEGLLSAHRGDYRVVYEVDDEHRVVRIIAIGHRADVYRR